MLNIKRLITLPLILYFLPAFVFFIGEKSFFPYLIVIVPIALFFILISNKNKMFQQISFLYKHTPFKYFIFLYVWSIITGVVAVCCGYYTFARFFSFVIVGFILRALFVYFYPQVVIPRYFSLKSLIKLFTVAYLFIFLWGIFEFIGAYFHIDFINSLISILSNIRGNEYSIIIEQNSNIPRIRSVCMEPGTLGLFIAVNLPIIFHFSLSKFKIFQNSLINMLAKKTLVPLAVVCLFLSQSPIYFIICLLISLCFFMKPIIKFLKLHYKSILIFFIVLMTMITFFQDFLVSVLPQKFFFRIIKFFNDFFSFNAEKIIFSDPSLGTRIVNNLNQFVLFMKHPIFGIGFGNNGNLLIEQFLHSPVTLPPEMELHLQRGDSSLIITTNAMYYFLHKTGFIGFLLYCVFMVKCIIYSRKLTEYFYGIEKIFVVALNKSLTIMFIISILYNQSFMDQYLFFLTALVGSIITIAFYKKKEKELTETVENNEK